VALPIRTRRLLRQDIISLLYATRDIVISSTTAASTSLTALTDSALAPAAQSQDYVRAYINISTQPAATDSTSTVNGSHNSTTTTLAVTDGTDFTVNDGIQVTVSGTTETVKRLTSSVRQSARWHESQM